MGTQESLTALREYWLTTESPFSTEEVGKIDSLLAEPVTLSDDQWNEFFERLSGPEGCDFTNGESPDVKWNCKGGNDKTFATAILTDMGVEVERVLTLVDVLGGHCDCEILFNAAERILPTEGE